MTPQDNSPIKFSMPGPKKKFNLKAFFSSKKTLTVLALCVIGFIGYRIFTTKKAADANRNRERITTVLVRKAEKSSLKRFLDLYAELKAENEVQITSPVSGKVMRLSKLEGQSIGRGQSVLTVDRFEVGARYAPATVQSPVAGVVTRILVSEGEDVTAGKAVAVVGNPNRIEAVIKVPESSAHEIKIGQDVFFQSRSIPDRVFQGKVTRRDLSLDTASRSLTVRAMLSNTGGLLSGIYAESYIYVEEATNVYIVPDSALTTTQEGKDAIYVSINDKAELRPVTIALRYRDQVALSEGIQEGDQMVVFGREYLSPGVAIRPMEETIKETTSGLIQTNN